MSWMEAEDYRAIIGGCHFLNVPRIIEHNGCRIITIKRNSASVQIGVDTDILNPKGDIVAEVRDAKITIKSTEKCQLLKTKGRSSIVENESGRTLYDLCFFLDHPELDFRLSVITHLPNGIPVFLHPNRIRIGSPNILKPHISSLKLTTRKGMEGPALNIKITRQDKGEQYVHVPRVPMVGPGGVVANLLTTATGQVDSGMSILKLSGKDNRAANISFQGPCYFLDVAFENFKTAIEIEFALSDKPVEGL